MTQSVIESTLVEETALSVARPEPMKQTTDLDMYRKHFAPTASQAEWEIFCQKCALYGLNPMCNEIYLVGRSVWDAKSQTSKMQYTAQVSITGLISMAEKTGRYEGQTEAEYYDEDMNSYPVWPKSKGPYPYAIRIGVYKKGHRGAAYGIAYFHERCQKTSKGEITKQWLSQGIHMLLKCALAAAIRWEFAETTGGVYIHEEMAQVDQQTSITPEPGNAERNQAIKQTKIAQKKEIVQEQPLNDEEATMRLRDEIVAMKIPLGEKTICRLSNFIMAAFAEEIATGQDVNSYNRPLTKDERARVEAAIAPYKQKVS